MPQKWYDKATVQSAIVNAIPNLAIAAIAIMSIVVTCNVSKKQISQSQTHFATQMERDSTQSVREDSVTQKQLELTKLQLEVLNKQYLNDSTSKIRELLIANSEYELFKKQNQESDVITGDNLFITKASFVSYKTKYQGKKLDSIFGFSPDIYYRNNENQIDEDFQLLHCLSFYNFKTDSEFVDIPQIHTINEAQELRKIKNIDEKFSTVKKIKIVIQISNETKFAIRILNSTSVLITTEGQKNPEPSKRSLLKNYPIINPNSKQNSFIELTRFTSIIANLNKQMTFDINLDYLTIHGKKTKKVKMVYSPLDKAFLFYD